MIYCKLNFNGINLDDELVGYTTVNIEGRGLMTRDINTLNIEGRDGDYILGGKYPPRKIIVHYVIKATSNRNKLYILRRLNEYLQSTEDVLFYFADEDEVFRYGRVVEVEDPPFDQWQGLGKFVIHCQDPYQYGRSREAKGKIITRGLEPVDIEKISFKVSSSTKKLIVKNERTARKIVLNGNFSSANLVEITKDKIFVNGQNRMEYLDPMESDFHEFKLYRGDEVTVNYGRDILINYRERWI